MAYSLDEQILRATKEIVVKFIETGRVSPAAFPDFFKTIYATIEEVAKEKNSEKNTAENS
jgi:predicted transcriptional regulator